MVLSEVERARPPADDTRPPAESAARRRLRSLSAPGLGLLVVLALWQAVYLSGWKPAFVLPSPAAALGMSDVQQ